MTRDRIRGYCPRCRHEQLFNRSQIHHGIHLLFTFLTFGLWLVSWIAITIGNRIRPWRCQQCNWYKPLFNVPKPNAAVTKPGGEDRRSSDSAASAS
jgi:hypothetical protein